MQSKIIEIIAEQSGVKDITLITSLDSLDMDKWERSELMISLEETFNITISQEVEGKFKTVLDIANYLVYAQGVK